MSVTVLYSVAALHETAIWIWENNLSVRHWPEIPTSPIDVAKIIKKMFMQYATKNSEVILGTRPNDDWTSWSGTGGYYIIYSAASEEPERVIIEVTILVDPAIVTPELGYVEEVIDTSVQI